MSDQAITLSDVVARLVRLEQEHSALKAGLAAAAGLAPTSRATGPAADDEDLDGQYGDPVVKYGLKEKYWAEQPDPFIGCRFSECSAEYLEATAKYLSACAYMARKKGGPEEEKKASYKDRDAARARGWAARIRSAASSGRPAPAAAQSSFDDEIPF